MTVSLPADKLTAIKEKFAAALNAAPYLYGVFQQLLGYCTSTIPAVTYATLFTHVGCNPA